MNEPPEIPPEGWDWLEETNREVDKARESAGVDRDEIMANYSRCFSTPAGAMVLEDLDRWLKRVAGFDPALGFENGAAYGFYREGQNTMVAYIREMAERGRKL